MIKNIINTCRSTAIVSRYSQSHLQRPENVLEHTGFVAVACLAIGQLHPEVNMESLLSKAICHDLEESVIGDIINPVKYATPEITAALENLALEVIDNISIELDFPSLPILWMNSKDDSLEGRIVTIVDVISVVAKLYEEVAIYGNLSIIDYANNTKRFFTNKLQFEKDSILRGVIEEALVINNEILGIKK